MLKRMTTTRASSPAKANDDTVDFTIRKVNDLDPQRSFLFYGRAGTGKTTISEAVFEYLQANHWKVGLIDGDAVRQTICRDLGFSKEDRDENVRRVAELAEILTSREIVALVSLVSAGLLCNSRFLPARTAAA